MAIWEDFFVNNFIEILMVKILKVLFGLPKHTVQYNPSIADFKIVEKT